MRNVKSDYDCIVRVGIMVVGRKQITVNNVLRLPFVPWVGLEVGWDTSSGGLFDATVTQLSWDTTRNRFNLLARNEWQDNPVSADVAKEWTADLRAIGFFVNLSDVDGVTIDRDE